MDFFGSKFHQGSRKETDGGGGGGMEGEIKKVGPADSLDCGD